MVTALAERARSSSRTLEEYLRAVLVLASRYKNLPYLGMLEFLDTLSEALSIDSLPFDPLWADKYNLKVESANNFAVWEATVQRQVVDLREMADAGAFANELRYFGVVSPRGAYWFNFDVGTYLECATAGSYGGWEPGDSSARQFVSGQVGVLKADGSIIAKNPRDLAQPARTIDRVSWEDFTHFVECGQFYE